MKTFRAHPTLLAVAATLMLAGCVSHTHETTTRELAGGAITQWTEATELFMEHPALVAGAGGTFAVHLTRLSDFAPLATGPVHFRFTPRDGGEPVVVTQPSPRAPGIFGPRPVLPRAGTWDLVIEVESPDLRDRIEVSGLVVHANRASAPVDDGAEDGGIGFLKEQQWRTPGFTTAFARAGRVAEAMELAATLALPPEQIARITAPLTGVLHAAGPGLLVPGRRVTQQMALAYLAPLLSEGGGALARARAELREAEDEAARADRLVRAEAAPERRSHEAAIRLEAAREALRGLEDVGDDGRVALRAPIAGLLADLAINPGSRVEAGATLATVVDPSRLWLEVPVPERDISRIATSGSAGIRTGDRELRAGAFVAFEPQIDSVTRTVRARWWVANPGGLLRPGQLVRAIVPVSALSDGVMVPAAAILEEDGRPFAFVQTGGESFERRALVLGARGLDAVIVREGIAAGERVVTGAAYQIKLASLSTAVPTHGHEH